MTSYDGLKARHRAERGNWPNTRTNEHNRLARFIGKLVDLDNERILHRLLWDTYSSTVRIVLNNKFVFQPFWDAQADSEAAQTWEKRFNEAKSRANKALAVDNTAEVLSIVLARLYTLRNQLVHGGATWNSAVNRDQIRDCSNFLGELVPALLEVMMNNPNTLWGDVCYPVLDS